MPTQTRCAAGQDCFQAAEEAWGPGTYVAINDLLDITPEEKAAQLAKLLREEAKVV